MNRIARFALAALALAPAHPLAGAGTDWALHIHGESLAPIPAFARLFKTACSTCHVAAPKLNVLGEAFRLNGYQMPESELLIRYDEPVSLGAEPWKDLWPRAIWPGDLPGQFPFSLRIQSDLFVTRDPGKAAGLNYHFPHEVYLLAGTPLGDNVGAFFEAEWAPGREIEIIQAKVAFQDPIPGLGEGRANLWLGLLNPHFLTFTDRQTDRAARQKFSWQEFSLADLEFPGPGGELRSANDFVLGTGIPAVEVNGRLGGRFRYGVGVAQGVSAPSDDANGSKDWYYHAAYKLGGLDFEGQYAEGGGPQPGTGGQLLDHSVTFEHFAYFGREDREGAPAGAHRALGAAIRVLRGPLDAGVGWVDRRFEDPFGLDSDQEVKGRSLFAKVEYLAFPWLILSAKGDRFDIEIPRSAVPATYEVPRADATRFMPGIVALVRQNIRAIVEGEIYLDSEVAESNGLRRPHTLWLRFDLAF
jgi:hypothetical protein